MMCRRGSVILSTGKAGAKDRTRYDRAREGGKIDQAASSIRSFLQASIPLTNHPARLKYCTARSCFLAAAIEENVPRFFRFPDFTSFFREYSRYSPDFNLRIMQKRCDSPLTGW